MKIDYVYIFLNDAFPGVLKNGITHDVDERLRSADMRGAGVIGKWYCVFKAAHLNAARVEKAAHFKFKEYNLKNEYEDQHARELFRADVEKFIAFLAKQSWIEGTVCDPNNYLPENAERVRLEEAEEKRLEIIEAKRLKIEADEAFDEELEILQTAREHKKVMRANEAEALIINRKRVKNVETAFDVIAYSILVGVIMWGVYAYA